MEGGGAVPRTQRSGATSEEEKLRRTTALVALLATFALVVSACAPAEAPATPTPEPPAETPTPEPPVDTPAPPEETPTPDPGEPLPGEGFLACQVSDTGGIDDRSFNENAWAGMQQAEAQLGVEARFLESVTAEDYARNINQFIADGCDIIITVGFLLGDDTQLAAEANPDQRFAIVDFAYDPPIENVEGLVYATEEAAMLAGYASASWSRTGIMGTFGGINIPPVTVFMDGFVAGANYWNQEQGADVRVLGWDPVGQSGAFTGNFDSTDDARAVSIGMLQEGADVILPVGGPIGIGTFAAIEELAVEAVGLGVDVDWTLTVPEFSHLMLTHIIKRIDVSVYQAIERAVMGEPAVPVFVSTLENGGVDLGEFHDYDGDITQEVRDGIDSLRQGIIDGSIQISEYFAAP
jgi:basic membrane protein A and related proteins